MDLGVPEVIAASLGALLAGLAALRTFQVRLVHQPDTLLIVGLAALDAGARGHRKLTVTHLALALLCDDEVTGLVTRAGASTEAVYAGVERSLPPRELPVALKAGSHTFEVAVLLRAAAQQTFRPRPRDVAGNTRSAPAMRFWSQELWVSRYQTALGIAEPVRHLRRRERQAIALPNRFAFFGLDRRPPPAGGADAAIRNITFGAEVPVAIRNTLQIAARAISRAASSRRS